MSNRQPPDSEPLPHELKISRWYQQMNADDKQQPSAELDANILSVAKKVAQKSVKNNALRNPAATNTAAEGSSFGVTPQPQLQSGTEKKSRCKWRRHLSLAASVAILGVLFVSQYEFFVSPKVALRQPIILDTSNEEQELSILPTVQTVADNEFDSQDIASKRRLLYNNEQLKRKTSEQTLVLNPQPAKLPTTSMSQVDNPAVLEERMFDSSLLADNSAQTQPMSLFEMSKLAEVLRTHQSTGEVLTAPENKVTKMQQTLFEHLMVYQRAHPEYKIEQKFIGVLTFSQINQLKSKSVENESNNTSESKN